MRLAGILSIVALTLMGCASAIQERNAIRFTTAGMIAERRGDWDTARRALARATVNARHARMPEAERALLHYEYGRALGVTCFFDLSEAELKTALDLDERTGQPIYLSLVELARLNLDQRKFEQATEYFTRAKQALDEHHADQKDPLGYADVLQEYGQALTTTGHAEEGRQMVARAHAIGQAWPGLTANTDRTPYGKLCTRR